MVPCQTLPAAAGAKGEGGSGGEGAAAAATAMLTVPQWACKFPAVHWQNNGAGTLTANLPDAYTYTLVPHGNGTLLIANLAP